MKVITSLFHILVFLTVSCTTNDLKGTYYDAKEKRIFEFTKNNLIIYDIQDSISENYITNGTNKSRLGIKNKKDKTVSLSFSKNNDTLTIFDAEQEFFTTHHTYLTEIETTKDLNTNHRFWLNKSEESHIILNFNNDFSSAVLYLKPLKEEAQLYSKIHISKLLYFNKFYIYNFQSNLFEDSDYLLQKTAYEKLSFINLNSSKNLIFTSFSSKENSLIFGKWKEVNKNTQALFVPDKGSLKNFGNILILDNSFKASVLDSSSIIKEKFSYEMGLDYNYIIIPELEYSYIQVKKITSDSLILINPYFIDNDHKPLLMKYVRF